MVFFTCNSCGGTLKKNQVDRHFGSCGNVVSCIDCFKDFRGQEYAAHTKCVSEAEKYNGPDWKPSSGQNKGEKKQLQWVETVNAVLEKGRQSMNPAEIALMKTMSKHDNVPRKKPKFLNFIKNIAKNQFDFRTIEAVWDRVEGEWKSQAELMKAQEKPADKPSSKTNGESTNGTNGVQNGDQTEENGEETSKKRKKDKKNKRKREEMEENGEEVKKQKRDPEESTEVQNENDESTAPDSTGAGEFRWGDIIKEILMSREDHSITIKKLKKKVFAEYYARVGDSKGLKTKEDLTSQLNKKLKKKKFKVIGETAQLIVNDAE